MMAMKHWTCARCKKDQEFTLNGLYDPHVIGKQMVQICKKCEKDFFKWIKMGTN